MQGCSALMVVEYKEKYYKFIKMLAEGHNNMSHMAREIGVATSTLYDWAKKDDFKADLDSACRGLLPLNVRKVINGLKAKAEEGEAAQAKLYLQHETGWSEKSEVKTEIVNADSIVSGVIEAMKRKGIGNDSSD